MTREEAIDILHGMRADNLNLDDLYTKDKYDALGIAIEALNNALVANVPCEDTISRQEALNCFTATKLKKFDFILYAREEIKNLPPITPQSKTGHWIAQDIHNCHTCFKCSECGYIHSFMHLHGKPTADYTYCPNCGRRMVESQESEERDE